MSAPSENSNDNPPPADPVLAELLVEHRDRLRRMIDMRMDQRLNGRVDASDVIQEAYMDASRRFEEYQRQREVSPFVWLRFLAQQKLAQVHRQHLGVQARDAARDISINTAPGPDSASAVLAAQLAGRFSSPSNAANRAELRRRLQDILNELDEADRDVLALRHFEQLDNQETAEVLGIQPQAAYKRYVRAIRRLKQRMEEWPDSHV